MLFSPGDVVSYVRNRDGTKVMGVVERAEAPREHRRIVIDDCTLTADATAIALDIETDRSPRPQSESPLYRLWLPRETAKRVGHPVCVDATRLSPEPDGILLRLLWIKRPKMTKLEELAEVMRNWPLPTSKTIMPATVAMNWGSPNSPPQSDALDTHLEHEMWWGIGLTGLLVCT